MEMDMLELLLGCCYLFTVLNSGLLFSHGQTVEDQELFPEELHWEHPTSVKVCH